MFLGRRLFVPDAGTCLYDLSLCALRQGGGADDKLHDGFAPGQVFILAPSTKGPHVRMLEQALVRQSIPCFFQTSDEA
jgi:hypothetical protein